MLPVTALAVAVVAVLALVFPGVRQQLALSASHQPQEYVALSFARADDGTVPVCTRAGGDLSIAFTVGSGLRESKDIAFVVTAGKARRAGSVTVEPGESVDVTQVLPRPARRFEVAVRLPEDDRRIRASCRGATR